ncbi:MAG: hypothetical protein Q8908_08215 [Bacteroidota bacterium]|nr:hypothetical protein [Bacteroidota bacterium]
MKKTLLSLFFLLAILSIEAQCISGKGIMGGQCSNLSIVTVPAYDVSVGMGLNDVNTLKNIMKIECGYIDKNNIVYGGSIGFRPHPTGNDIGTFNDASIAGFLGYNLAGCIIITGDIGLTRTTTFYPENNIVKSRTNVKVSPGMAIKFITMYAPFPITFGGYASNAAIGMTIGTIF